MRLVKSGKEGERKARRKVVNGKEGTSLSIDSVIARRYATNETSKEGKTNERSAAYGTSAS